MLGKPVYLEIIFSEQPMVLGIRENSDISPNTIHKV